MVDLLKELRRGRDRTVYALVHASGPPGPHEFYKELSDQVRGRYLSVFIRACTNEVPISEDKYYEITKFHNGDKTNLWEFRDYSSKTGFLSFNDYFENETQKEDRIILTHGIRKKTNKLEPDEIEQALKHKEYYFRQIQVLRTAIIKTQGTQKQG